MLGHRRAEGGLPTYWRRCCTNRCFALALHHSALLGGLLNQVERVHGTAPTMPCPDNFLLEQSVAGCGKVAKSERKWMAEQQAEKILQKKANLPKGIMDKGKVRPLSD
jgi:hypothetical protein